VLLARVFRDVPREGQVEAGSFALWQPSVESRYLDVNVAVAHFARENFCPFTLAPAGSVFQADVPAVPAADHLAGLNDAFTQRKSEMRAEVLDGINGVVPAKERDLQSGDFDRMAETFRW
jgi:hypothetical protein